MGQFWWSNTERTVTLSQDILYCVMLGGIHHSIDRFGILGWDDLQTLEDCSERRTFDKRTLVLEIGQPDNYLNFVVNGLVRKYLLKGSEEIITQLASEGDLVASPASFLKQAPSEYALETIEPTVLISFSKTSFDNLLASNTKWERWARMVITDLFLEYQLQELDQIRYNNRERFIRFFLHKKELFDRVPQKHLASYLRMKPETFSRLKHSFFSKLFPEAVPQNV